MDQLLKDMALLAHDEEHKVELIGFDLLVDFGNDVSFSQPEPQVFAMDAVDVQLVSAADAGFHRMPHNNLARRPGPDGPFLKEDLLGGFQHFDAGSSISHSSNFSRARRISSRTACRSEERRVGKKGRSQGRRWSRNGVML